MTGTQKKLELTLHCTVLHYTVFRKKTPTCIFFYIFMENV